MTDPAPSTALANPQASPEQPPPLQLEPPLLSAQAAPNSPLLAAQHPTSSQQHTDPPQQQQESQNFLPVHIHEDVLEEQVIEQDVGPDAGHADEVAGSVAEQDKLIDMKMRIVYLDHDYDTADSAKRQPRDSQVFPEMPVIEPFHGNSERILERRGNLGYDRTTFFESPQISNTTARMRLNEASGSGPVPHLQRPGTGGGMRTSGSPFRTDQRRVVVSGGHNFTFTSASTRPPAQFHQFKANAEFHYNTTPTTTSAGQTANVRRAPMPSVISSQSSIPRRPQQPKLPAQSPPKQAISRSAPSSLPAPEPPHRVFLAGKQAPPPPPPSVYQPSQTMQAVPPQQQQPQPQQPYRGPIEDGVPRGAPMLVAGRGAKPVMRGRAGTVRRKDENDEEVEESITPGAATLAQRKLNMSDSNAANSYVASNGTNFVIGNAPPEAHVLNRSPTLPAPSSGSQNTTPRIVDAAVQQNVTAIRQSLSDQQEAARIAQTTPQTVPNVAPAPLDSRPLPAAMLARLQNGECMRTLPFKEAVALRTTIPELPTSDSPSEQKQRSRVRVVRSRGPSLESGDSSIVPPDPDVTVDNDAVSASQTAVALLRLRDSIPPQTQQSNGRRISTSENAIVTQKLADFPNTEGDTQQAQTPSAPSKQEEYLEDVKAFIDNDQLARPIIVRAPSLSPTENDDYLENMSHTTDEPDWGDYVNRCWCEMTHNDDNMVQCDGCNVWQHIKCMGLSKAQASKTYYCEQCQPRELKWTKEKARAYQEMKVAELNRETEKRRRERRKRREERIKERMQKRDLAKLNKEKPAKKSETVRRPATSTQFRKYTEIKHNEYSPKAKAFLSKFPSTQGALQVLQNVNEVPIKYGRMFVAPEQEGLVAITNIAKNDLVIEYVGHVSLPPECPGREREGYVQPHTVLYSGVGGDQPLVIDARRKGSDARFVRRSCRPNTVLKHVVLDGNIHVLLNATEYIDTSTEITIPFDSDYQECPRPLDCACGDEMCCPIADFNYRVISKTAGDVTPKAEKRKTSGPRGRVRDDDTESFKSGSSSRSKTRVRRGEPDDSKDEVATPFDERANRSSRRKEQVKNPEEDAPAIVVVKEERNSVNSTAESTISNTPAPRNIGKKRSRQSNKKDIDDDEDEELEELEDENDEVATSRGRRRKQQLVPRGVKRRSSPLDKPKTRLDSLSDEKEKQSESDEKVEPHQPLTREERKLQQQIAIMAKNEQSTGKRKASSPVKEKGAIPHRNTVKSPPPEKLEKLEEVQEDTKRVTRSRKDTTASEEAPKSRQTLLGRKRAPEQSTEEPAEKKTPARKIARKVAGSEVSATEPTPSTSQIQDDVPTPAILRSSKRLSPVKTVQDRGAQLNELFTAIISACENDTTMEFALTENGDWPQPSVLEQPKKKKVSLDEYKQRRRSTVDGNHSPSCATSVSTSSATTSMMTRASAAADTGSSGMPKLVAPVLPHCADFEAVRRRVFSPADAPQPSNMAMPPPPPPPATTAATSPAAIPRLAVPPPAPRTPATRSGTLRPNPASSSQPSAAIGGSPAPPLDERRLSVAERLQLHFKHLIRQ